VIVKRADRLEAAHIRHEDIDDHLIEGRIVERREAGRASIGDLDLEAIALEPGPNGEADMRIVIDNQNASHNGFSRRDYAFNETPEISCTAVEMTANQCVILISASMQRTVCPQRCIATIVQLIGLAQPGREAHLGLIIGRTDGCRSSKEPTRSRLSVGRCLCLVLRLTCHLLHRA
jgi:hypothetical protein